jgi:mevalonate kinase
MSDPFTTIVAVNINININISGNSSGIDCTVCIVGGDPWQ